MVRIFDSFKGDGLLKGRVIQRRETSLVVLDGWELRVTDAEAEEEAREEERPLRKTNWDAKKQEKKKRRN